MEKNINSDSLRLYLKQQKPLQKEDINFNNYYLFYSVNDGVAYYGNLFVYKLRTGNMTIYPGYIFINVNDGHNYVGNEAKVLNIADYKVYEVTDEIKSMVGLSSNLS